MLRMFILVISALALLAWTAMFLFIVGASGGGRKDPTTMLALIVPFPVLAFYVLSCTSLIEERTLKIGGIVANVLILPFVFACFLNGIAGAIAGGLVLCFMGLWYLMYRRMMLDAA